MPYLMHLMHKCFMEYVVHLEGLEYVMVSLIKLRTLCDNKVLLLVPP
jgi:hypothetical protein